MHIIAGHLKNRTLVAPKGSLTRPTSSRLRETLFNICQGTIEEATFLDLFAGSGAIGFEALSRGAKKAILVDNSRESIQCINKNIDSLKVHSQAKVILSDVFAAVKKFVKEGQQFDVIYADPPYEKQGFFDGEQLSYSQQLLNLIDALPLLKEGGYFFVEDVSPILPEERYLKTLKLVSLRRAGKTSLCEFKKFSLKFDTDSQ